ncbi:RNA-binding protein [Actinoalloteichus sp. AHMU CJ021]|nr:RNA-binding protein [Actinoalloteichus sp. AHMU CJ021]
MMPADTAGTDPRDPSDPEQPAEAGARQHEDGDGTAAEENGEPEVDWEGLPEPVRLRLAEISASALGGLSLADVPHQLRPVARFTPAKRARLGAVPLLATVRASPAFRAAVANWARRNQPELLDVGPEEPAAAAAAGLLVGDPSATRHVEEVARRVEDAQLRTERDAALNQIERLTAELERVRAALDEAEEAVRSARATSESDLDRLRRRLREQGTHLRAARDEALVAREEADQARRDASAAVERMSAELERERERTAAERVRADRAVTDAETARQAAREARQADEVRLALLVDTLDGAVTGLRRELALGGSGPRPADLVGGASQAQGVGRVENPAALDRLLALPSVHVVVDGYNVTKTGYPDISLAQQRDRLNGQLGALAARTGAEVTVVFDGAGVVAVPVASARGVRVLFSDPGVLADDVIRALVAAEPEGRPVVVVTSDRAVADSVRRRGAHPVPSSVLLARLNRI